MPLDRHGNEIPGSYGPTGAPTGRRSASPPAATNREVTDLTSLLKKQMKGGTPTFAGSRRSAAPMRSVGTPSIGGKRSRRGRDTMYQGAETRVSRPRAGRKSGKSGVSRRGAQAPPSAASAKPAMAGPAITPNDPNSFQPAGASAAAGGADIARAAMSGAPAMPGVRRPTRPGGMLGGPPGIPGMPGGPRRA